MILSWLSLLTRVTQEQALAERCARTCVWHSTCLQQGYSPILTEPRRDFLEAVWRFPRAASAQADHPHAWPTVRRNTRPQASDFNLWTWEHPRVPRHQSAV